jgi:hypothetical protein
MAQGYFNVVEFGSSVQLWRSGDESPESMADARTEAIRLSRQHPGSRFYVWRDDDAIGEDASYPVGHAAGGTWSE